MTFEVFDRDATPGAATPGAAVVISAQGSLLLSRGAKALLDRVRPSAKVVELLYDRDTRRVAIRPLNSSTPGSKRFAVQTLRGQDWPVSIDAREFVQFWKLPQGREQLFSLRLLEVDRAQVLVFDLREANGETLA